MPTNFPASLDTLTNPTSTDAMNSATVPHATQHANLNDAVEALEAKVGVNSSAVTTSLDYKITNDVILKTFLNAKGDLISATADNTPAILTYSAVNGQVLTVDTSTATGLKWSAVTDTTDFQSDQNILAVQVFG